MTKTCTAILTDEQIATLRREAAAAGDREMVRTCDAALHGDREAWAECCAAIEDASAQQD